MIIRNQQKHQHNKIKVHNSQIYKILDIIHIHGSPLSAISTSSEQAISEM